tara:strand:- start:1995 stop:2597 length:603 start_codon:yes stop_codon:yes gene_type:complete
MVKTNEIILLVGAAIAAYLFTSNTSKNTNVPFINPYYDLRNEAQAQIVNQNQNNISTLESVRQSNLGIADNILTSERNIADLIISRQQTELDRTQSYVSSQQKIGAAAGFSNLVPKGDWQKAAGSLLSRITRTTPGQSVFPDFKLIANRENYNTIYQQSKYETAQENIRSANASIMEQQAEIDRVNEEYRINYGDISRYG